MGAVIHRWAGLSTAGRGYSTGGRGYQQVGGVTLQRAGGNAARDEPQIERSQRSDVKPAAFPAVRRPVLLRVTALNAPSASLTARETPELEATAYSVTKCRLS